MSGTILILGMAVVAFILIYISFKIDSKEHFLLQILLLFFVFFLLLLISKASFDAKDDCAFNVVNSSINGSVSSYEYEYQCSTNTHNTASLFYWLIISLLLLVFIYIIVAFGKYALEWVREAIRIK